jgi:glycine/D-amino acid oxidase-like deaminating enzyme
MNDCDIAVIGAGVFGSWTAWHLRRAGKSVLLLDSWGPGHSRSSSGGESRIIRMGYGEDEIYTRMAMRSLALWKDLIGQTRQPLFHRTGVLWMARPDDSYSETTRITLDRVGVPIEILPSAELAKRSLDDPDIATAGRSWHEQIGDPTAADGILDRLVHNAHRIEMRGDSIASELAFTFAGIVTNPALVWSEG